MSRIRPSINEIEDTLETLQDLYMFSTLGDEICSLVLNMERLLVRERINNLKQSIATYFFKRKLKKEKASESHLCQFFTVFIKLLKNSDSW